MIDNVSEIEGGCKKKRKRSEMNGYSQLGSW